MLELVINVIVGSDQAVLFGPVLYEGAKFELKLIRTFE